MHAEVNGTRLWFDVDGLSHVPDGAALRERPTLILVHGGPGSYDHSYFKPEFARLSALAQVIYLDLRGHGRSARDDLSHWSFELCADDLRAFCDTLGITRPIVWGHSMGGFIVMLYGARHPAHAAALVLQSTFARFDLERLVHGFQRAGGDAVAALARRSYGGVPVSDDDWARIFAAFGPNVPGPDELARRIKNPALSTLGMQLLRELNVVDQLARISCRTLVCVGQLDPVVSVDAARELFEALPVATAQFSVLAAAGHFPWKDVPAEYWAVIERFLVQAA